jgi:hypothetical protein
MDGNKNNIIIISSSNNSNKHDSKCGNNNANTALHLLFSHVTARAPPIAYFLLHYAQYIDAKLPHLFQPLLLVQHVNRRHLCLLCSPLDSPDTILAIIITSVYATDMLLNFFVAFYEDGELVTDLRAIARKWLSDSAHA